VRITGLRLVGSPANEIGAEAQLLSRDGTIDRLARRVDPRDADVSIDVGGLVAVPGAIDPHVHFDEPGFTEREDFAHGSASALRGGVTTIIDMPCTSLPPVVSVDALRAKLSIVQSAARCDFALFGGVDARRVEADDPSWRADLAALHGAGVVGFKAYTISGMASYPALTAADLLEVFAAAASHGAVVALHAEDPEIVARLTRTLRAAGRLDPAAWAEARPSGAECLAVAGALLLQGATGVKLHVVHVASARAAELLAEARSAGADVSAETCPHYLAFTIDDLVRLGARLKTAPVVKGAADRERLWQLLACDGVQFVATDHAPCRYPEDKETGDIWTAYGGVPGTELMLPYLVSEGVHRGRLDWDRLIAVSSTAAARRYGLWPRKGSLTVGADADLALLDPDLEWTVRGADLASKGRFTPFEGHVFKGQVVKTVLRGHVAFDREAGFEAPPGTGRFVQRAGASNDD
jgi:allantoinase